MYRSLKRGTYNLFLVAVALRLVVFPGDVPQVMAAQAQVSGVPAAAVQGLVPQRQAYPPEAFLDLANVARESYGAAPLSLNQQLNRAALAKAQDMAEKGYFEHFRPSDGKTPWAFIQESGYQYQVAGENLARGFRTPEGITRAWLASPAHLANIISPNYREVGFACISARDAQGQEMLLTVEMFGSR